MGVRRPPRSYVDQLTENSVNLPAHLVVVKGTRYFDAKIEGYKDMDLTDVLQMLGRAGRPQFDTSGIARIFTQDAKKAFYKHFLHTGFPVESSLHKVLDNHLGAEVSAGVITTKQDALDYLTWTFFFRRLHKNPTYYGLEISAEEHKESPLTARELAADYMVTLVDKSISDLADSDCLLVHSNGDVDATPFGRVASYYYLSHQTIRNFLFKARKRPNATFEDALAWVSQATEFDDLPVRHNEDLINAELAKNLPLDTTALMGGMPLWDPHVKAFLLLQAYMSRVDLPISDYLGDQTSVLDQSIRIIQAGIDVMTELNRLDAVRAMIHLLQCVKSARWPTDFALSILPGVSEVEDPKIGDQVPTDLVTAATVASRNGKQAVDAMMNRLSIKSNTRGQFGRAINMLPDIELGGNSKGEGTVNVTMKRRNRIQDREGRVYAPRFPKPQNEGYFVVVTPPHGRHQDVLALKRANWSAPEKARGSLAANARMKLGESEMERKVEVTVMSDSYPGMEWKLESILVPRTGVKAVEVAVDEALKKGKKTDVGGQGSGSKA